MRLHSALPQVYFLNQAVKRIDASKGVSQWALIIDFNGVRLRCPALLAVVKGSQTGQDSTPYVTWIVIAGNTTLLLLTPFPLPFTDEHVPV
jgi:hypothetical protein